MSRALPREMQELNQSISVCQKCALAATRTNAVFGVGSLDAKVMFIGIIFMRRRINGVCAGWSNIASSILKNPV